MRVILNKVVRHLTRTFTFFLPEERRIAIERRQRGREEARKLRLADGVIVSFGKSGRTWLRVMLSRFYQVRHGLPGHVLMGFDNLHRKNAEIPRLLFTHDNYLKDFTGHADTKEDYLGKKVVLLVRHPADVAVSQFYQWKHRMRPHKKVLNAYPPHGADVGAFEFVMGAAAGLPKIIAFMNLWAQEAERLKTLLVVRYEDLKAETEKVLERVVSFLGTPGTPEQIKDAVAFASFENMKKMEARRTFWLSGSRMVPKDRKNPHSFKVRKGKVGGFRDEFTPEQIATIESFIADNLDPFFGYVEKSPCEAVPGRQGEESGA